MGKKADKKAKKEKKALRSQIPDCYDPKLVKKIVALTIKHGADQVLAATAYVYTERQRSLNSGDEYSVTGKIEAAEEKTN